MAETVYGVNKTKFDAGTIAELGTTQSALLCSNDSYVCSSLEDASTINFCPDLPKNSKLQFIMIKHPAFATGRTVKIGTTYDDAAFAGATAVASAGTIVLPCGNYVIGTAALDNELMLTTAGIFNSATAIQFSAFYTL